MTKLACEAARALIAPYADGELGLEQSLAVEVHLEGCEACRRELAALRGLGEALRAAVPYHRVPDALRARLRLPADALQAVEAPAQPPGRAARATRRREWLRWSLPLAASLALAFGIDGWRAQQRSDAAVFDEAVAGHVRSLQAAHLADVASTDQHTVKPWFAGKLDYAPPVHDLAAQGYPLLGGRLDYLQHRTVAALVFGHRKHLINLYVWPASSADSAPAGRTLEGYDVVRWRNAGMQFVAVSDLNATELTEFAHLQERAGAPSPPP